MPPFTFPSFSSKHPLDGQNLANQSIHYWHVANILWIMVISVISKFGPCSQDLDPLKSINFQVGNFRIFTGKKKLYHLGDSKWPFLSPHWRSLNPWKGHLTIPKRSLWITRIPSFETHRLQHFKCPLSLLLYSNFSGGSGCDSHTLGKRWWLGCVENVGPLEPMLKYRPWGHVDRVWSLCLCFNQIISCMNQYPIHKVYVKEIKGDLFY